MLFSTGGSVFKVVSEDTHHVVDTVKFLMYSLLIFHILFSPPDGNE